MPADEGPPVAIFLVYTTASGQSASSVMKDAYKSIKSRKLTPQWLNASKVEQCCDSVSTANVEAIFVLDNLEGDVFRLLVKRNMRIITPYVIKYCDEGPKPFSSIPKRSHPIFSQCMRGLTISCSNLPTDAKKVIEVKVKQMCGDYDNSLKASTSFLVSSSVTTVKYRAAIRLNIPVMRVEWIDECFAKLQYEFILADSKEIVEQFRLPIFHGLTITCSGIESDDRTALRSLIEEHGGTYSPALRFDVPNMILLLKVKHGEKYTYAKKKNIPRLRMEWLQESILANYALSMEDFNIDADEQQQQQQPSVNQSSQLSQQGKANGNQHSSAMPSSTSRQQPAAATSRPTFHLQDLPDTLDNLALAVDKDKCGSFFDGLAMLAIGFEDQLLHTIKRCIRLFGAISMDHFKPMVTHVIVGPEFDSSREHMKRFEEVKFERFVTIDWLVNCLKSATCCDYLPYKFDPYTYTYNLDIFSTQAADILRKFPPTPPMPVEEPTKPSSQVNLKAICEDNSDDEEEVKWSPKIKASQYQGTSSSENFAQIKSRGTKHRLFTDDEEDESADSEHVSKKQNGHTESTCSDEEEMKEDKDDDADESNAASNVGTSNQPTIDLNSTNSSADASALPTGSRTRSTDSHLTSTTNLEVDKGTTPVIMFSGFEDNEKKELTRKTQKKLHLKVCDSPIIESDVTHLILMEPYATEKTVCAIAAGIWLLTPEFITDSLKAGRLLPEEKYTWSLNSQSISSTTRTKIVASSGIWRKHIAETGKKPFDGWSILWMNKSDESVSIVSNSNILKAGGAKEHYIGDFVNRKTELKKLLPSIKFAILDYQCVSFSVVSQITYYKDVLGYFLKHNRLIMPDFISRFILMCGPGEEESSLVIPDKRKWPTLEELWVRIVNK